MNPHPIVIILVVVVVSLMFAGCTTQQSEGYISTIVEYEHE